MVKTGRIVMDNLEAAKVIKEGIEDADGPLTWKQLRASASLHPLYQKAMQEAKLSDIAQALGVVHNVAVGAYQTQALSRLIIDTLTPAKGIKTRVPVGKRGRAFRIAERTGPRVGASAVDFEDIEHDIEYGYDDGWSQTYLEDVTWDVLKRNVADGAGLIAELELEDVIALYEGITIGDAAGGALMGLNDGASFVFADVIKAWKILRTVKYLPTDMIIAIPEAESLLAEDDYQIAIDKTGFDWIPPGAAMSHIGRVMSLNLNIWATDKLDDAHKIIVSRPHAALLCERRPLMTLPWEEPQERLYGFALSQRIGLGVVQPLAVGLDS
ncbi:MAG: hypothetical protein NWE89_12085 [Candidatus Bathyarchaeota archaeon]|nr:hypothetical protein [Candidatus Bathyarchaeota archaeon]